MFVKQRVERLHPLEGLGTNPIHHLLVKFAAVPGVDRTTATLLKELLEVIGVPILNPKTAEEPVLVAITLADADGPVRTVRATRHPCEVVWRQQRLECCPGLNESCTRSEPAPEGWHQCLGLHFCEYCSPDNLVALRNSVFIVRQHCEELP